MRRFNQSCYICDFELIISLTKKFLYTTAHKPIAIYNNWTSCRFFLKPKCRYVLFNAKQVIACRHFGYVAVSKQC